MRAGAAIASRTGLLGAIRYRRAVVGLACVAMPALVGAQPGAQPPTVRGVVVDSSGRPLEGAEVGDPVGITTRTDASGRFAFPPRAYVHPLALAVRRVGFIAQSVTVTTADTALRVVLRSVAQVLDTVVVATEARSPVLIANGFYDRQRKTTGRHLDSLALRQYSSTGLVGVLRETNRVSLRRLGADDYAYTTIAGRQCRMNVFVDGRYDYTTQPGPTGGSGKFRMEGVGLRELLPFEAILAIEIYPSVHSVPSQFQRAGMAAGGSGRRGGSLIPSPVVGAPPPSNESGDAACGAIVIWTKRVEGEAPQ